ncbi:MAG: DNA-primase RepB domain-containing protein [Desulfomonilaceae bacterium]
MTNTISNGRQYVDINEAGRFLDILTGSTKPVVTFQTFDDSGRGDKKLNRVLHGTLDQQAEELGKLNGLRAGIFVMVNAGDLNGRKEENVTNIRAVFLDLDGSPIDPVLSWELQPHIITQTSPGIDGRAHYQCFWRVSHFPLDKNLFVATQTALCEKFEGDPNVTKDLCRVMRIPGFYHQKVQPFRGKLQKADQRSPYLTEQILAALEIDASKVSGTTQQPRPRRKNNLQRWDTGGRVHHAIKLKIPIGDPIPYHHRNNTLFDYTRYFKHRGHPKKMILNLCQDINKAHCKPPLTNQDVEGVVNSAYDRYPSRPSRQHQFYLSDGATAVHAYLMTEQAGRNVWIKRSCKEIAAATDLSERQVRRCMDTLEKEGYVLVRSGGSGRGATNGYFPLVRDADNFSRKGDTRGTSVHLVLGCSSDSSSNSYGLNENNNIPGSEPPPRRLAVVK